MRPTSWVISTRDWASLIAVTALGRLLDVGQVGPAPWLGGGHHGTFHHPGIADHHLACRSSGSISIAISLLVSAPPRSTRMATRPPTRPRRWQRESSPRWCRAPPSGLPPQKPSGTSLPTIWRTMSAAPLATSGECETMTISHVRAHAVPSRTSQTASIMIWLERAPGPCGR